ncbi:hypothetical protein HOB10_02630 [Candidatus Parcubacteria bacterium]|jgi:adenine/guanine phosphoribosyltransferase-like PRPP-binding protein|nr:hypothetical protein [Candidatus Parcubacteria bacterium]
METFKANYTKIEKPENTSSEDFKVQEIIEELRDPLSKIIEQVLEKIKQGKYGLIIGDDASGRIPTIILSRFMNKVSNHLNTAKPKVGFFTGSSGLTSKQIESKKEAIKESVDKSDVDLGDDNEVLVVTDTVATGASVAPIFQALKEMGVNTEVATIGIDNGSGVFADTPLKQKANVERILGVKIYHGQEGTPDVFYKDKGKLSGVEKNPEDLHAHVYKPEPEMVIAARKYAEELADELFAEFKDRL